MLATQLAVCTTVHFASRLPHATWYMLIHVLQYMVTYQLITALGKTVAFCMSGYSFSFTQVSLV